jgi:hypothetical protein
MQQQARENLTPEELAQARRIAETPSGRAALAKRYGDIASIGEVYPDQPQAAIPPPPSPMRAHNEALRQRQQRVTGEGVPSDAARMISGSEGASGLAGRQAAFAREEARPTGRVTKYSGALSPEQTQASRMAKWIKYQGAMDRLGTPQATSVPSLATPRATGEAPLYLGAGAGQRTGMSSVPDPSLAFGPAGFEKFQAAEAKKAARSAELERRKLAARQLAIPGSALNRAIAAARAGDPEAQRALDERRIRWRA